MTIQGMREKLLEMAGCIGPHDEIHRCSALHCNHCGFCDFFFDEENQETINRMAESLSLAAKEADKKARDEMVEKVKKSIPEKSDDRDLVCFETGFNTCREIVISRLQFNLILSSNNSKEI